MRKKFFRVLYPSRFRPSTIARDYGGQGKSKARVGEIYTEHGVIKTPAFVPVATKGTLKTLLPNLIKEIGVQVAFVNTYHLVSHPGVEIIQKAGGIHKFSQLDIPLMSDSGGFQVFSLAVPTIKNNQIRKANIHGEEQPLVLKISDEGVKFRSTHDGQLLEFTPEKSIEYQIKIGADLLMAFDECTYYPASYEYAKNAMERTHRWLIRCLKDHKARYRVFRLIGTPLPNSSGSLKSAKQVSSLSTNYQPPITNHQFLYGIIQGAVFEDLRKKSAEFIASQPIDGIAIGGVAVGESKKEMREQVKWTAEYLPGDKPVHLLGVGQFDDILAAIKYGIDTFDCVEPTRLARMGKIYQIHKWQEIDILKGIYKNDLTPVDKECNCYVCENFTKAYLHHLFKQKEILGYTLATYHNLFIMERFFEKIREIILEDKL